MSDRIRTGGLELFLQKVEKNGWVAVPQVGGASPYLFTLGIQLTTEFHDVVISGIPQTIRQENTPLTVAIVHQYYVLRAVSGQPLRDGEIFPLCGKAFYAKEVKYNAVLWESSFNAAPLFNDYHEIRQPRMMQIFWADTRGHFPWHAEYRTPRNMKPQLDFATYSQKL